MVMFSVQPPNSKLSFKHHHPTTLSANELVIGTLGGLVAASVQITIGQCAVPFSVELDSFQAEVKVEGPARPF